MTTVKKDILLVKHETQKTIDNLTNVNNLKREIFQSKNNNEKPTIFSIKMKG